MLLYIIIYVGADNPNIEFVLISLDVIITGELIDKCF